MAEIGAASGFGRGTLYHHIESKEGLLHEIASQYISDLVDSGHRITDENPDPVLRLSALSRHLMSVISNSLAEIVVCFREVQSLSGSRHNEVMCMHAEYQQIWSKTIEEGVNKMCSERSTNRREGPWDVFLLMLVAKADGLQSPEDIAMFSVILSYDLCPELRATRMFLIGLSDAKSRHKKPRNII